MFQIIGVVIFNEIKLKYVEVKFRMKKKSKGIKSRPRSRRSK